MPATTSGGGPKTIDHRLFYDNIDNMVSRQRNRAQGAYAIVAGDTVTAAMARIGQNEQKNKVTAVIDTGSSMEPPNSTPSNNLWRPPVALWHLFVLILLTGGLYIFFWSFRVAAEIQKHQNRQVRPWLYPIGLMIPFVGLFVVHRQATQITSLNTSMGQQVFPSPQGVVGLLIISIIAGAIFHWSVNLDYWYLDLADPVVGLLLVSPCWLIMQHQLNVYKQALTDVHWTHRPFRFTKLQYLSLVPGLIVVALSAYLGLIEIKRANGERLEAGERITGASDAYALVIPSKGWVKVPTGTFGSETDLELYGPTASTRVVAYFSCRNDLSLDQAVEFRRSELLAYDPNIVISEKRNLLSRVSAASFTCPVHLEVRGGSYVRKMVGGDDCNRQRSR
jgi:hypothetical protein